MVALPASVSPHLKAACPHQNQAHIHMRWTRTSRSRVCAFAGQMRKSPFSFSSIGDTSPLLWLARRYAILDGPTMPIVAEGDEEPNNTYVEQLTASARAAVQVVFLPLCNFLAFTAF